MICWDDRVHGNGVDPDGEAAGASFAATFARVLDASGLTLEGLRRRLADRGIRISQATLSYWRAGRRQPERSSSLDALVEIEDLLGLPTGELSTRLARPRRPGPRGLRVPLVELMDRPLLVGAALEQLDLPDPSDLAEVWIHHVLDINEETRRRTWTVRGLFRAQRDGIDRKAVVLTVENPLGDAPRLLEMSGCRPGRRVDRTDEGVFALELLLDHPLRSGEQVVLEYRTVLPDTVLREGHFACSLVRRVREVTVWVRFHGAVLPVQATTFTTLNGEEIERPVQHSPITAICNAQHAVGPGKVGVRWSW